MKMKKKTEGFFAACLRMDPKPTKPVQTAITSKGGKFQIRVIVERDSK